MDIRRLGSTRSRCFADRAGRHGDVRPLRPGRRRREHRHHPRGPRRRRHADRHRRLLRHGPQRDADPRRPARPQPRRGRHQRQVRGAARPGRLLVRRGRPACRGAELPRLHPAPAGHRPRGHLPAVADRPGRAGRGHRRCHRRAGRGRLRPPHRPVGGRRRDVAARARRPSDLRPADRVLPALAGDRAGDPPPPASSGSASRHTGCCRAACCRGALERPTASSPPTTSGLTARGSPARTSTHNLALVEALAERGRERGATVGPGRHRLGPRAGRGHRAARRRPPTRPARPRRWGRPTCSFGPRTWPRSRRRSRPGPPLAGATRRRSWRAWTASADARYAGQPGERAARRCSAATCSRWVRSQQTVARVNPCSRRVAAVAPSKVWNPAQMPDCWAARLIRSTASSKASSSDGSVG